MAELAKELCQSFNRWLFSSQFLRSLLLVEFKLARIAKVTIQRIKKYHLIVTSLVRDPQIDLS